MSAITGPDNDFEAFEVGLRFRHARGKTITELENVLITNLVMNTADAHFNELLVIGFLSSMRKEWDWRVSRGESLRNLEAFRSILQREGDPGPDGAGT